MAISNHATEAERAAEVEREWQEFWKDIVIRPDGSVDLEQMKKELADFSMVMEHCRQAYGWMTNDRVTKVNTEFETVKAIAEEIRSEEIEEALKEEREDH